MTTTTEASGPHSDVGGGEGKAAAWPLLVPPVRWIDDRLQSLNRIYGGSFSPVVDSVLGSFGSRNAAMSQPFTTSSSSGGSAAEQSSIPFSAALLATLTWNTDNSDVDLHVTDPCHEECYYAHRDTKIGGHLTRDVVTGYGPEMFLLPSHSAVPNTDGGSSALTKVRLPVPGDYHFSVRYFRQVDNKAGVPSRVSVEVAKDWALFPYEQYATHTVVLEGKSQQLPIATVQYGSPPTTPTTTGLKGVIWDASCPDRNEGHVQKRRLRRDRRPPPAAAPKEHESDSASETLSLSKEATTTFSEALSDTESMSMSRSLSESSSLTVSVTATVSAAHQNEEGSAGSSREKEGFHHHYRHRDRKHVPSDNDPLSAPPVVASTLMATPVPPTPISTPPTAQPGATTSDAPQPSSSSTPPPPTTVATAMTPTAEPAVSHSAAETTTTAPPPQIHATELSISGGGMPEVAAHRHHRSDGATHHSTTTSDQRATKAPMGGWGLTWRACVAIGVIVALVALFGFLVGPADKNEKDRVARSELI